MTEPGRAVLRIEDERLLRGRGRFVDNVTRPRQLWMKVVRSHAAHGHIRRVRTEQARSMEGVATVLTGEDLAGVRPIPLRTRVTEDDLDPLLQPVLARDRVRYVGEPVAVVAAEDRSVAEDAAELVLVEIEELPVVLDARAAVRPEAPALREGVTNEAAKIDVGYGDVEAAFASAVHVLEMEVQVGRHSGAPLETRGLVAEPDRATGRLEVWGATKVPHFNRRALASMLGIPSERIHMHTTDAGGGFGVRGELYPEDFLVVYLALTTGRPVKWIEDRGEHLVAANHSREQRHRIAAAFDEGGRLLGLRDEAWHDNGAYIRTHGVIVPDLTATMLPGPYRVPAYRGIVHVAMTNKTPCGTYRGPGRFEGTFARERLLDLAADRLGIDRIELRRRNLLDTSELPHRRELLALGTEMVIDPADYAGLLDRALEVFGFEGWMEECERLRARGRPAGAGVGVFLEKSGLGPEEHAAVEVDGSERVRVLTGGASLGQGIETVLAQVAADELGVDPSHVEVVHGDTDLVPEGVGSWASRSTVVGGSAVLLAARAVAEQARDRGGDLRGLSATHSFSVDQMTYPFGVHLAQVELDPGTGEVQVRRYAIAYEVGRAINPALVEGQLVGGAAQGIAGALLEQFTYDDAGQPLSGTLSTYLVPSATEVPAIETLVSEEWPAAGNPLGVRGAGEGGTSGAGAAIASAVEDALGMPGAIDRLPISPERVFALLRQREGRS